MTRLLVLQRTRICLVPTCFYSSKLGQFSGSIPIKDLEISYSLSSGPGGQHVNKTSTKVLIRFNLDSAQWLTSDQRDKVKSSLSNCISKDGYFHVRSDKTKSAQMNRDDAVTKLRQLLWTALEKPPDQPELTEEQIAAIQRGKAKANRERIAEKRKRSLIKKSRSRQTDWD